ncbi:MAG TPA: hypothetical protein VGW14_05355 [Thermoleophilaceae bacterium]|nr:hypothetical protein [Thermoleophilaceae bacterium]
MSGRALGRVADLGDGTSFSAHVEYAESEGPFSFMIGPDRVEAGVAVGWARRHARRVVVRVGSEHFSAGEEPHRDLPAWPGPVSDPGNGGVGPERAWHVEASTAWFRSDGLEVAERLAEALRAEPEADEVGFGPTEAGFRVTFAVAGAAVVEARETASRVLRSAWAAAGIEAAPGDDFDASSITVHEGGRPDAAPAA